MVSTIVGLFELMIKLYFYIVVIRRKFNLCFWVFPNRYFLTRRHLGLPHIIINPMPTPIISYHRPVSLRSQRPWKRREFLNHRWLAWWCEILNFMEINAEVTYSWIKERLSNLMLFFCISKALSFPCKLKVKWLP